VFRLWQIVVCSVLHKTLHLFILLNHFQPTLIIKTFHLVGLGFQSETPMYVRPSFYLTTIVCHFSPLFRLVCGRSV